MATSESTIDDQRAELLERLYTSLGLTEAERELVEQLAAFDAACRAVLDEEREEILVRIREQAVVIAEELSIEVSSVLGMDVKVVFDESPL